MKLATLQGDRRDGVLVVVSNDLAHCLKAPARYETLQSALEDWAQAKPLL